MEHQNTEREARGQRERCGVRRGLRRNKGELLASEDRQNAIWQEARANRLLLPTGGLAKPSHSAGMDWLRTVLFACFLTLAVGRAEAAAPDYNVVVVEPTKTSIYVGNVSLTMNAFRRSGATYVTDYKAKVFPYFFSNEHGTLSIDLTDDDLARLARGEVVQFKGRAENSEKEERRIEGRAVPSDASRGKIKVRVFVTQKIELIFNTTYRFGS